MTDGEVAVLERLDEIEALIVSLSRSSKNTETIPWLAGSGLRGCVDDLLRDAVQLVAAVRALQAERDQARTELKIWKARKRSVRIPRR